MALAENALSTYDTVRTVLGLSVPVDDTQAEEQLARVELIINVVSAEIESYVRHPLWFKANDMEEVPARGTNRLFVRRTPVRAVHVVSLLTYDRKSTMDLDPATYSCVGTYADAGIISRNVQAYGAPTALGSWANSADQANDIAGSQLAGSERQAYRVIYSGGWITPAQADVANGGIGGTRDLPYDIEHACIQACVALHSRWGINPNISSATLHQSSMSWDNGSGGDDGDGPSLLPAAVKGAIKRYRRPAS